MDEVAKAVGVELVLKDAFNGMSVMMFAMIAALYFAIFAFSLVSGVGT